MVTRLLPQTNSVTLLWDYDFTNSPSVTNFTLSYGVSAEPIINWDGLNVQCACYSISNNAGTNLSLLVTGLIAGSTNYFRATASDDLGNTSEYSTNEVRYVVPTNSGSFTSAIP